MFRPKTDKSRPANVSVLRPVVKRQNEAERKVVFNKMAASGTSLERLPTHEARSARTDLLGLSGSGVDRPASYRRRTGSRRADCRGWTERIRSRIRFAA